MRQELGRLAQTNTEHELENIVAENVWLEVMILTAVPIFGN